jgi:hypothetical protein
MGSALVTNTNVNYTNYYNLINVLADYCGQHPSIATTGNEDLADFDEREFPNYPVANINVLGTTFTKTTTDFQVQILIADKYKEKNNESNDRTNEMEVAFFGTDDKYDVWANTLGIMNDVTSFIQRGVTGFEINGEIACKQFHERFDSGLAGWTINFTLTTHNDKNRCLFELYPN